MVAAKRALKAAMDPVLTCEVRQLPRDDWSAAAAMARELNPVNAPNYAMMGSEYSAERITLLTGKYFGPAQRTLSVQFLDGPNTATKNKILAAMNAWGNHPRFPSGIRFAETGQTGQIRIARARRSGFWSYLGTDNLRIPVGQPTMNLEAFNENTPDSEYNRVVKHETGHALGFPHEHARAEIIALLDRAKVYAYFERTQGWTRSEIDAQVLTPLAVRDIMGTPPDVDSIMTYQFPGSLTVNGRPIPGGLDINDTDAKFAASVYPPATPTPEPGVGWTADGSIMVKCGHCGHAATITPTIKGA